MNVYGFDAVTQTMADKIEEEFCSLACCEGTVGLAIDLSTNEKVDCFPFNFTSDDNGLDLELIEMMLILPSMYAIGLNHYFWCFTCKTTGMEPCACGKGHGIYNVDWDLDLTKSELIHL